MIPYSTQTISKDDIKAVMKVIKSDFITQGPQVGLFEKAICKYTKAKYACAVSSATAALHLACMALGLKKGDFLWTSSISFVASANCALYCNAKVDFIDIDQLTNNISIKKLEHKLKIAKKNNKLPKILVAVHLSGLSCDMQSIYKLSKKYNFYVIEDASHALGGTYRGNKIGSCKFSDISILSFHPVKIITTGEGGMALTNKKNLFKKINNLRTHGITRKNNEMINPINQPWYYQQIDLGYNYRMTDMQAALGVSQMKKVDKFVESRNKIAKRYDKYLSDLPIQLPNISNDCYSSFHLYIIRLKHQNSAKLRNKLYRSLLAEKIYTNIHYIPIHTQPHYKRMKSQFNNLIESEKYFDDALSIPIFPKLKKRDQNKIIDLIKQFFK